MPRFIRCLTLFGGLAALLCMVVVGTAQASHARPRGADPFRASLVPAYNQCTAPNRTHGPPLAFPSCTFPTQTSAQATVGSADANGATANFVGSFRLHVHVGAPGAPDDSDVEIRMELADVRCIPTGARCGTANASGPADYSGEIGFKHAMRLTDHYNGVSPPTWADAATVQDAELIVTTAGSNVMCAQTASTSIGSTCNVSTTYNVIFPGLVKDGKRVVEEIDDLQVFDGGADGSVDTTGDNSLFLRPGVFIP